MADGTFVSQKFGISVAIDGDYAVVGAHESYHGGLGQTNSGIAMIFHRTGANNTPNTWDTGQKIVPLDPAAYDEFGTGVAISGNTAVIGAPKDDDNSATDSGSVYVFVRSGTTWTEQEKLTGGSGTTSVQLGHSVSISGDFVVAGARYTSDDGTNSGAAYVFRRTGTSTWHSGTKILASWDAAAGDQFGQSVAIDGDHVIIGAHLDTDNGRDSGSAYIFHKSLTSDTIDPIITLTGANPDTVDMIPTYTEPGYSVDKVASVADNALSNLTTSTAGDYWITYTATDPHGNSGTADRKVIITDADWDTETKIVASDDAAEDVFGTTVAMDGDYAIVGAPRNDDGGTNSGCAYIFRRTGANTWDSGYKIVASDDAANDEFGHSVAISGDYAIVGAWFDDDTASGSGSAYIFRRTGTNTWDTGTKIVASGTPRAGDQFGQSVAIDGDFAIVGAPGVDSYNNIGVKTASNLGAAYVFRRFGAVGTNNWQHEYKLTASDANAGDYFGSEVGISGDYAIAGAQFNDGGGTSSGAAYIFRRTQSGVYDAGTKIVAADGDANDWFGNSVDIDGDYAVVGAPFEDNGGYSNSGAAYIFHRTGTGNSLNTWDSGVKIGHASPASSDVFGMRVSISGDYVLVGSYGDDNGGTEFNNGSAHIFRRTTTGSNTWDLKTKLTASDTADGDAFGWSVAISGNHAIVGARDDDDGGYNSGSAYIFHNGL